MLLQSHYFITFFNYCIPFRFGKRTLKIIIILYAMKIIPNLGKKKKQCVHELTIFKGYNDNFDFN